MPAYIQINGMQVLALSEQGSASANIRNVWVFANSQSLGVYELPASVPVLEEGLTQIVLRAGVMNNGISSTRTIYPFYAPDTFSVQLTPLQTVNRSSLIRYTGNTAFALNADFEVGNSFTDLNPETNLLTLTNHPNNVFEGSRSAMLTLNAVNSGFEIGTLDKFQLPGNKVAVYLEMNYKCDQPFLVALKGTNETGDGAVLPQLYVNKKETWNKIYIDLTETVSAFNLQGLNQIQLIFKSELEEDLEQAVFFWDNVKILYQL
ncbi:MAG: hypothetical protein IPM47_06750 [Sphingobacteriales bacterium]|nr:MAG: hypothetical protein IPM47_06750 [Sphingobacteriales bacterium]